MPPLLAAGAVAIVGAVTWAYLVDDAFVVARYARHLATGDGWAMNPGEPSDGVTGPLWLLPVALAEAVGVGAPDAQRVLGLAATIAAAALTSIDLASRSRKVCWTATALLALQPTLGVWGGAGLETGLATLLMVLLARPCWLEAPRRRARVLAALAAFALPAVRPELVAAGAVLALGAATGIDAPREPERRRLVPALALVAGLVLVAGFRWTLFGHPLPLALGAKSGSVGEGLRYVAAAWFFVSGGGGLALVALGGRVGGPVRLLGVALAAHSVAVALAGGDWMPGQRLLMPVLPLYAVGAAFGLERLRTRWVVGLAGALALAVPVVAAGLQIPAAREAGALRRSMGPEVAAAIEGRGPVAMVDVGYLGWLNGEEVVDLGGITDAAIARAPGGHLGKRVPLGYLVERAPRTLLLHSATEPMVDDEGRLVALAGYPVERELAALPWTRSRFRVGRVLRYRPGYWYVRLDRVRPR